MSENRIYALQDSIVMNNRIYALQAFYCHEQKPAGDILFRNISLPDLPLLYHRKFRHKMTNTDQLYIIFENVL